MAHGLGRSRLTLIALVGAAALVLAGATSAQAALVKLTGSTTVTPSEGAKQFLEGNGVSVAATGRATSAEGSFTFPIVAGFGATKTYNGLLAHAGGLRFTKGDRSKVVRRFVAVRAGDTAVLLAQIPGLRGGCRQVRHALRHFALKHPGVRKGVRRLAQRYPKAARRVVRALRRYCADGRVIVLARLTNLGRSGQYGGTRLTADLRLSRQAARLINRVAGSQVVAAGALLGSATSTVTPEP
jgi:hypothetical protein